MSYYCYTRVVFFILSVSFLTTTAFSQTGIDKNSLGFDSRSIAAVSPGTDAQVSKRTTSGSGQSVQNAVTFNNLAVHYAKNQDFDNAVQSLQKAVASDPKMQEAYINLSIVSEMMKNNTDSIAAARKAVALDGKNVRARMQLCDISLVSKLFVESAACFEELQKLTGPDELTMLKYGIALSQTDDADRALPILQKVVRAMPNYVAGWNALGMVYFKKKMYSDAADTFSQAVSIAPDQGQLRYNLAIAQLENKNKLSAISQYNLLADSDPNLAKQLYRVLYGDKVIFAGDYER